MGAGWPGAGFQAASYGSADELTMLKSQAELLRSQLEAITNRLEELEKES
jgi:hypothetical protein